MQKENKRPEGVLVQANGLHLQLVCLEVFFFINAHLLANKVQANNRDTHS